jgi:hypothetical protein
MGLFAHGTFNGTGAALYIGIGFIPDWVKVRNVEDGDLALLEWSIHMTRAAETTEGILTYTGTTYRQEDARTDSDGGITIYRGGDKMTAASTAYLVKDNSDYRTSSTYGSITTWTLGNSTNRTGNFNLEADTTYVGEGSRIYIEETVGHAFIYALTSNGEQANEVTLSESVKSGTIHRITGMYDYKGAAKDVIIPAGFAILATSVINVSGELAYFEAGQYDA